MLGRCAMRECRRGLSRIPNDGKTYLYYLGNECVADSGGWGYFWHHNRFTNGFFERLDDCFYFGDNSSSFGNPLPFCLKFIDFTKYTRIGIDYEIPSAQASSSYDAYFSMALYSFMPVQGGGDGYVTPTKEIRLFELKSNTASSKARSVESYDMSDINGELSLALSDWSHAMGSHKITVKLY